MGWRRRKKKQRYPQQPIAEHIAKVAGKNKQRFTTIPLQRVDPEKVFGPIDPDTFNENVRSQVTEPRGVRMDFEGAKPVFTDQHGVKHERLADAYTANVGDDITFALSAITQIHRGLMDQDLDAVIMACQVRKIHLHEERNRP